MDEFILSMDLGTSSLKAMCIKKSGEAVRTASPYDVESWDLSAQNTVSWWKSIKKALSELSSQVDLKRASALALTAQTGTYLLYKQGIQEKDIKVVSWKSDKGTEQLRILKEMYTPEYFKKHISMPHPDLISYPAPKILYFKETMADEWNRIEKILQPKDYIYYKLTGVFTSDPYTWRGLSDLYDKSFHDTFLNGLGISKDILPQLFEPSQCPGSLLPDMADELGLESGIPVFVGCNDFFASLLGMGIIEQNQCFDMTGTSEHIGEIAGSLEEDTNLVCGPYIKDFIHYGVTANSGSSISWAFKNFGQNTALYDYAKRIMKTSLKPQPPIFLPYMQGERAPIWDMKARGVFFGLDCTHNMDDMFYSVMEGVAFSLYHIWTYIQYKGKSDMRSAGGAAFNDGLSRIKASLFGLPFAVMKEKESAALGAAILAGVGCSWFPSLKDAIESWVKIDHVIEPDKDYGEFLKSRFEIYKGLYPALKDSFTLWDRQGRRNL